MFDDFPSSHMTLSLGAAGRFTLSIAHTRTCCFTLPTNTQLLVLPFCTESLHLPKHFPAYSPSTCFKALKHFVLTSEIFGSIAFNSPFSYIYTFKESQFLKIEGCESSSLEFIEVLRIHLWLHFYSYFMDTLKARHIFQ